jgi:hypothetical protein
MAGLASLCVRVGIGWTGDRGLAAGNRRAAIPGRCVGTTAPAAAIRRNFSVHAVSIRSKTTHPSWAGLCPRLLERHHQARIGKVREKGMAHMFLFRTLFWLSLVVLVLPTDAQQQARLSDTVTGAVHHVATFCDRQPATCRRGAEHWAVFRQKLEFGVRMAIDAASQRFEGQAAAPPARPVQPASGTLRPDDLAPAWRSARSRSGA